ncbi:MAG: lipoate--protein ligase, partial [Clostridia bacterium]|nr:lipoate--protein ligase [Clostridia bacterium]
MEFKFIRSDITDPQFNIASEEYLLKQTNGFYVYLWRNSPAVIIGKNQNTLLEVNLGFANHKGIKVVRRLTGGGAVYHDLNNVCYTVIAPYNAELNGYIEFTRPVIEFLNSLGVKAEFSGRNDICIGDKKISGNAQVVYKDRIMHHGTILFDTDLSVLDGVLVENKLKIQSKGIKSNRARVTNVKKHLTQPITSEQFFNCLCEHLKKDLPSYSFTDTDIEKINYLVKTKFSTYEWNIGSSPIGTNKFDARFDFGTLSLIFDLDKGLIKNAQIFGDYFALDGLDRFITNLNGIK